MKVLLFTFQLWAAMVLAADQPPNLERAQALQRAGKLSEARSIYETLLKTPGANPKLTCEILLELSRIDLAEGRYGDALRDGYRAASLARSRDSRALKGNALTVTGLARMYSGDYRAALNDLGEALRAARDTGDLSGEITRLNNLGTVLYYQGRYAEAMQRYREALQIVDGHPGEEWNASRRQLTVANIATIYQRLGQYRNALNTYSAIRASPVVLPTTERAQLLTNMGALYRRLGDPVKALETYRGAQALYRESAMKRGEITVLNNIGIAQVLDQHAPNEALKTFDLALKIAQESGSRPLELQARLYRGETFLRINRVDDADRDFSDAALMADSLNSPEDKWKALYGIARVGNLRGDRERAQKLLQKAVGLIESLRSNADTGTSRSGFLADKRQVYDLLIDLRIRSERCDARELFRLMEQCRARSLKDLRDARAAGDLDTVQRMIDAQTLLVEYWMNNDAVAAVWVTRDSAGVYARTGIGNFRKDVAGLSSALAKPRGQDWHSTAGRVARVLLDGVEGQLSRASLRRLIVVPDRDLGQLPFEILPISQKERLIDRIGVAYLPTASFLRAPRARRGVTFFWSRLLAAFADPAPGSGTSSIDLGVARDSTRLPGAAAEVREIRALLAGRNVEHMGSDARKAYLDAAREYRIVHLATHAFIDTEDANRSYILFAPAQTTQTYDYLFPKEISTMDWSRVDLVTASACDTQKGEFVEGEGIESFSQAFFASGVRTVVTSLWRVDDRATRLLMRNFYGELASGSNAIDALREAKLQYLRQARGGAEDAFYWAAFVVNGDPYLRLPFVVSWSMAVAGLLAILGMGLIVRSRKRGRASQNARP